MSIAKPVNNPHLVGTIVNQRGVAILVAIGVVAVLLTAGLALNQRIRSSVTDAIRIRDDLVLSQMATSGVHAAMIMLINDRKANNSDTLQEDWANPEKVAEMMALIPFDDGDVEVSIIDERGKIQVNALVKFPQGQQFVAAQHNLWERLLEHLASLVEEPPDIDANMIINSLKDWLDTGDDDAITGLSGAESDYYESLEPPYTCKNGPIDHLGEVALIQGVSPERFHGVAGTTGLSSLLTVYGATATGERQVTFDGKINIATADVNVLAALLPLENADLAQALADYRLAKADDSFINDITRSDWYKNVPGAGGLTIDADLITTASDLFRIIGTARRNQKRYTLNVVVQRQKAPESGQWECKTLNWQVE